MCLHVVSGPHLAYRPIPVFKVLHYTMSLHQKFNYTPNTRYALEHSLNARFGEVNEGYHAYRYDAIESVECDDEGDHRVIFDSCNYSWVSNRWNPGQRAVAFVIPKGATYYIGKRGDIVASEIQSLSLKPIRPRDFRRKILKKKESV